MRALANMLIYAPIVIGFAVGFVVSPFVIGFLMAYEFLASYTESAVMRMNARRGAQEK